LRVGEFRWLTTQDVQRDANGRPAAILIRRKTCPDTGEIWQPKHGSERVVPLTQQAADIVAQCLEDTATPWLFEATGTQSKRPGQWTSMSDCVGRWPPVFVK
jgi:integrase